MEDLHSNKNSKNSGLSLILFRNKKSRGSLFTSPLYLGKMRSKEVDLEFVLHYCLATEITVKDRPAITPKKAKYPTDAPTNGSSATSNNLH